MTKDKNYPVVYGKNTGETPDGRKAMEELIATATADECCLSGARVKQIVAGGAAFHAEGPTTAVNGVAALIAGQNQRPGAAEEDDMGRSRVNERALGLGGVDRVRAAVGVHGVLSAELKKVFAATEVYQIMPAARADRVVART